jgi:uncharacterized phage protein (TIGR01671 family)
MRELKFRAWDKTKNTMMTSSVIWGETHLELTGINYEPWQESTQADDIGPELMQYTGLKDKNGVEIYEGDVVKCEKEEVVNPWVVDNHGGADWVIWNLLNTSYHLHQLEEDMEVIGNIYQSPELIK